MAPIYVFLFFINICGSYAIQPGFMARITPRGFHFLSEMGTQLLHDEVSSLTIPDQSGSSHIPTGHVEYSASNMRITDFYLPIASVTTRPRVGLSVSTSGVSISLHGDWRYKIKALIPIRDHGTFDVSLSGVSLNVTIAIGRDYTGRPTVHSGSRDCAFNVGHTSVKLHGGASWLYNLFKKEIAKKLEHALNSKVCAIIVKEVNEDLARKAASIEMKASISQTAEVDYSMVASPTFDMSMTSSHKGEVYQKGNHTDCPYKIPTIPRDSDQSKMVFMWMTEYVANSAGYVLQNTGFFRYNVTQDKIPPGSKYSLNTSSFALQFLIPQVAKLYPNMMMQLNLNTSAPPTISIKPDQVKGAVNGDIAAYVIQPDSSLTYLFTLAATMDVSVVLGFQKANLTWKATEISCDVKLLYTAIDDFKVDSLRQGLQLACDTFIRQEINKRGSNGVPVPNIHDYSFKNPILKQGEGYVKIGTDLAYEPGWRLK